MPPSILLTVPTSQIASNIVKRLGYSRRLHSGLFPLWEGYYQRTQVVVSACEGDENVHAANVRHLAQFYRLSAAFLVEPVTAAREDLKPFDAVVGQEARHYFCPTALIGDMDLPDELIFRGREMNEWLAAPSVWAESSLVALLEKHWQSSAASAGIGPIKRVVVGTSSRPLRGWRFGEFVRVRFGVDVADAGGYGFLESCRDVGVPGAIVGVVTRDCSCHPAERFSRRTLDRALIQVGFHVLQLTLARPAMASP